jgi:hypothetical protein
VYCALSMYIIVLYSIPSDFLTHDSLSASSPSLHVSARVLKFGPLLLVSF